MNGGVRWSSGERRRKGCRFTINREFGIESQWGVALRRNRTHGKVEELKDSRPGNLVV